MSTDRTQVAIIGAGPAGLLLGHLLHRHGIESVILEARAREYCEARIRAGVLEQGTREVLIEAGVGDADGARGDGPRRHLSALRRREPSHPDGRADRWRCVTIYGQTEVVKDLIEARLDCGCAAAVRVRGRVRSTMDSGPTSRSCATGTTACEHELRADLIAGCDGFHGICRPVDPDGSMLKVWEREYPFAWLGILADVAPSTEELIYARHDRGFALHSMRSPRGQPAVHPGRA